MRGINLAALNQAACRRDGHLRIVGIAAETAVGLGKIPKFAMLLADLAGGKAFDRRTEDVSAGNAQQASLTPIFI